MTDGVTDTISAYQRRVDGADWETVDDQVIPPAELTFMAQRAHSQITYVKAGHLSMIRQPWAVTNVINHAVRSTS